MKIPTPASDKARDWGLDSRSAAKAEAAEQAIREMGPNAIPFLVTVLEEQARISNRHRRLRFGLFFLLLGIYCLVIFFLPTSITRSILYHIWYFLSLILQSVAMTALRKQRTTYLQRRAAVLFARMADKRSIGILIDLLACLSEDSRIPVRNALVRLLPDLQVQDAGMLTTAHRQVLQEELKSLPDTGDKEQAEFMVALLRALQQIGDSSFVAPVTNLCDRDFYGLEARLVTRAAEECLPYLEAFAEREQRSGTLVRAATAPESEQASALLLRPASTSSPSQPSLLLRPAGQTEDE